MQIFQRLLLLLFLISPALYAAGSVRVALISDGQQYQLNEIGAVFKEELLALTEGEFEVEFKEFQGDWTLPGVRQAFQSAYEDPGIDMVLAVGIVANQIGIGFNDYPKPTFVPLVFDGELAGAPTSGTGSGKKNLNYLTDRVDFSQDIQSLQAIVPYNRLALIADGVVLSAIPELVQRANEIAADANVEILVVEHDGIDHRLADRIPRDIEALMVAGLPRMPTADVEILINSINSVGIPSYSLIGLEGVTQGMLATDSQPADWGRLARRNALNMQAVMLGENAQDQQVRFAGKRELTINLETARKIGLSPRFDVLSEAVLLNEELAPQGPEYSLVGVAALSIERNLDLSAETIGVAAGEQDIYTARANQLPQLGIASSVTKRKVSPFVELGQFPENSSDVSLSVSQVIYSDDISANLAIQRNLHGAREEALQNLRLDIAQQATTAFLNVLRADTQLNIFQNNLKLTRTNLELAQDRVRVGSTSSADVYRWESRMATDRSSLLTARANVERAREALNRLLNRPLTERFQIVPVSLEDPFFMTEEEFNALVNSPRNLRLVTEFSVGEAMQKSPDLRQLDKQILAQERSVVNQQRSFWVPDVSVSGGYSKNIDQSGVGIGVTENLSDWNIGLNASLPLFSGGARKSELSKARYELEQLSRLRNAVREKVEQQVRATYHAAYAAYVNIELSERAAVSAGKNLELVTDSYARGLVSIIDLLDAQNASLTADESAANSLYDFLITIMDQQRAVGEFSFLLPVSQRQQIKNDMQQFIAEGLRQ